MSSCRFAAVPTAALAAMVATLTLAPAAAGADQVDDHIAVLQKKPGGMSNDTWREKRREAARELGRLGDKRAALPLIKIVETEKFDAIAEIAIEALGKLGDKRAVPVLKKVREDASRDQFLRDAAGDALAALGEGPAAAPPPAETPGPEEAPVETPVSGTSGAGDPSEAGDAATPEQDEPALGGVSVPEKGRFAPDVLAMSERWTFAVGSFALTWDTIADQPQMSGSAALAYHRGLEQPKLGYSFDGGFVFAGGAQDRDGELSDTGSLALAFAGTGQTELRFYLGAPHGFFLHAGGDLGLGGSAINVESTLGTDFKEFVPSLDAGLALGVGYGRTLDVGTRLRVARIEKVLRRARQLGRPINAEVANRLQTAWWDARADLGYRHQVVATLQILKEAGVLLSDPDATTVYQILRVLEDGQLDRRWDGWDVRMGVAELLVGRDNRGEGGVFEDDNFDLHREEAAVARATFARQSPGGLSELTAGLRAAYRLDDGSGGYPSYYAVEADVTWRRFFYGEAWDPRGALELGATLRGGDTNTNDDMEGDEEGAGRSASLRVGYQMIASRAARLGAAATLRVEGDDLFLGIALSGTWSLADASYAAW